MMSDKEIEAESLTCIVVTGGCSLIPAMHDKLVEELEDKFANIEIIQLEGEEGIARGATLLAGLWSERAPEESGRDDYVEGEAVSDDEEDEEESESEESEENKDGDGELEEIPASQQ